MMTTTALPTYSWDFDRTRSVAESPTTVTPSNNVRVYGGIGSNRSVGTALAEPSVQPKENGDDRSESRNARGDGGGSEKKEPAFGSPFRELPHSVEERRSGTQIPQLS